MDRKSDHARIYDDFEPLSNWKSEQGSETLTVYLPGFRKEQLKVQVTTTRKLRVMGERPAGANKWIRFRKEFPIPQNVDVDTISAKFEGANLVLRLPRPRPKPMARQSLPPPVPKENLKLPSPSAKETDKARPLNPKPQEIAEQEKLAEKVQSPKEVEHDKKEALKVAEKAKSYDVILNHQDSRFKVNEHKENRGGYVALMKKDRTTIKAGVVVVGAAFLLLSLGFYIGRMFTSS